MENSSTVIAWWGAILSTIVFVWNIIVWKLSGPKIGISISPFVYDWMGRVEYLPEEERIDNGSTIRQMKPFIAIEIRNTGKSATTILSIRFSQNDSSTGMCARMSSTCDYEPFSNPLPVVLEPGHIWLCKFDQEQALQYCKENGTPYFSVDIRHTHSKVWVRKTVEIDEKC